MTMSVLLILALRIIFVPFASTESGIPSVTCLFLGVENESTHKLPINEIPSRCQAIHFGAYYFNEKQSKDNIKIIASLVAKNLPVYTSIAAENYWYKILTTDKYDNEIAKMAKFMTDHQICGISLDIYSDLYDLNITNKVQKVNALVSKIKANAKNLKVGLGLDGLQSYLFNDERLFSFNKTNSVLDMYNIYTGNAGLPCWEKSAVDDRFPINLKSHKYVSLDDICQGVAKSCISKDKRTVYLKMAIGVGKDKESFEALEYPQYCYLKKHKKLDKEAIYCPDSMEIYKKRAIYVKSYFKGVTLGALDYDYWNDDCGVTRYSITNAMIDGWGS